VVGHKRTSEKWVILPSKFGNRKVESWMVSVDCVKVAFEAALVAKSAGAL
jgi:hypothetical protein